MQIYFAIKTTRNIETKMKTYDLANQEEHEKNQLARLRKNAKLTQKVLGEKAGGIG